MLLRGRLNPDRKVYVEWGNEMWNSAAGFHANENHDAALAEVAAGGSPLAYPGETAADAGWQWAWRRTADRGRTVSDAFRAVFGDEAMMTRIRPVLATQQDDGQGTLTEALTYLTRTSAQAPSHYFYGAGGSAYYNPQNDSPSLTLDSIWTSASFAGPAFASLLVSDAALCRQYGLHRLAYEGGPSLDTFPPYNQSLAVKTSAWSDPRMRSLLVGHHALWTQAGGELLCYYLACGTGTEWSFCQDVGHQDTQKLGAVADLR